MPFPEQSRDRKENTVETRGAEDSGDGQHQSSKTNTQRDNQGVERETKKNQHGSFYRLNAEDRVNPEGVSSRKMGRLTMPLI